MLVLLTAGVLRLFYKVEIVPRRERAEVAKMYSLIEKHYPLELLRALAACPTEGGKVKLPEEARAILDKAHGYDVVHNVIKAVETGRIEVLISGPDGPNFKETSQRLCATFTRGRITSPYLVPAYGSGKMGL